MWRRCRKRESSKCVGSVVQRGVEFLDGGAKFAKLERISQVLPWVWGDDDDEKCGSRKVLFILQEASVSAHRLRSDCLGALFLFLFSVVSTFGKISDGDKCLLGRNAAWKEPDRFSCLAGFLEPGESLEGRTKGKRTEPWLTILRCRCSCKRSARRSGCSDRASGIFWIAVVAFSCQFDGRISSTRKQRPTHQNG